jgi:hypothetical protein
LFLNLFHSWLAAGAAIANFLHLVFPNPTQVALQLFGSAQRFYGVVLLGEGAVGEETVHAAVAGLAQVHGIAVAAALFAGHQVVAAGLLHGALAEATPDFEGALGAGCGFGGGLGKLLAAGHGASGGKRKRLTYLTPIGNLELRKSDLQSYIDRRLADLINIIFPRSFHLSFLTFFL